MNNNRQVCFLFCSLLLGATLPVTGHSSELNFNGNLLNWPCLIDPSSTSQNVIFRDTATPLYHVRPGKSYDEIFQVKLINCQTMTIGKTVDLVFRGAEELNLPGYIQVSGVNSGKLGIGIIDTDGISLLKLNQVHNGGLGSKVEGNSVTLIFKAFVQATSDAILSKGVQPGDYNSTVTFELNYK